MDSSDSKNFVVTLVYHLFSAHALSLLPFMINVWVIILVNLVTSVFAMLHTYFFLTDVILSTNDDGIAPVDEREDTRLCFYEILANHFVKVPESGRRILDLIVQLWSQSFAANIFALLFHRWVYINTYNLICLEHAIG